MQRLLIVGCGDVAQRALPDLLRRYRVYALARSPAAAAVLRRRGVTPVTGDLDAPRSLGRLPGLADLVLHSAPPAAAGESDLRTRRLLAVLGKAETLPQRLTYISTTGVYGDCGGACIDETRTLAASTDRARRRVDAERALRDWGATTGVAVSILRAPGIYAADRLPLDRIGRGTPALRADEDGYTNHIHADDLAGAVVASLARGQPGRVYNTCDESDLRMGDWFDLVADRAGLPRPPRIGRDQAHTLPPMLWSFMAESRRIGNHRMKHELRVRLRFPTVHEGVAAALGA